MVPVVLPAGLLVPFAFAPGAVASFPGQVALGAEVGDAVQMIVALPLATHAGLLVQGECLAPNTLDVSMVNTTAVPMVAATLPARALCWKPQNLQQ
jgi:hypothetical protein